MSSKFHQSLRPLLAGTALWLLPTLAAPGVGAQPATTAALPAKAQPATTAAAAPTHVASLEIIVLEVKGTVQASTDNGKTWDPVKAGLHFPPGASFRTGFRSSVTCGIPPDQAFTIESLSTVHVDEAAKTGKHFKTDLVMKYGATNYSVETGGVEHATTIKTPGTTLLVRGTIVRVADRPGFTPTAESFTGRAAYRTARGTTTVGTKGGAYARVSADQSDAAQTALSQTVVDPATLLARTATDARLIAQQASLGALVTFDDRANIPVIRNGAPLSDADLLKDLPGTLDFVLRWTGNADLNLVVDDQPVTPKDIARGTALEPTLNPPTSGLSPINLGQIALVRGQGFQPQELLFPGFGLNVSSTGGVIPYDNRGGPKGGMEIAYWNNTPPLGEFGVAVLHASGAPANFTVNAFLNGSPINIFYLGATGPLLTTPELKGNATGSRNDLFDSGIVFVPSNPYFQNQVPTGSGEVSNAVPSPATASAAHALKPVNADNHARPASASPAPMPVRRH